MTSVDFIMAETVSPALRLSFSTDSDLWLHLIKN